MTPKWPDMVLPGLTALLSQAADAAAAFVAHAQPQVKARIATPEGKVDRVAADEQQHIVHGFGWYASYAELLREVSTWAAALEQAGEFTEVEALLAQLLFAEYGAQMRGGIAMNQGEVIRPADLCDNADALDAPALTRLIREGGTQEVKTAIARHLMDARGRVTLENCGLDETLTLIRDQFFALSNDKVAPHAHEWHLKDELIPIELVDELGEMGVFAMTIPEEFGGLGMGKTAMCVVSEELSRGWIGVGSLATRSEIAAELILTGGTLEQKQHWLPQIASAAILPTAVFTEPDTGSDLGSLRTRATLNGEEYSISGNKTWITHAARADVMTLLVRTNPETRNHSGLSMLIAPKMRGDEANPFPSPGMSGGEIGVIGYRGMKEYEIGFDDFRVRSANLLGGVEGQGFKQLMATFESARIQTAARAIGVAQASLDVGLAYAMDRKQFGRPIIEFPRVANKLAMMAAEIMGARQLTYFAARRKDESKRCDLEAGMAKLIGARVAWAAADNALQIHGGNGFAMEYVVSRLLADARILNIFEGAGEIQAQVIARRLLDGGN
ncbi:MAG: acyl-CoA dehydrogenase [Novosphingobium sp. 63-713]|uniref:acyl-CoA dehydrogenase family protein n=1 Tax=unclassified Novosphingobium TaxID=2644732 RepID=UPI000868ED7B|nr:MULTISPECIES: acyl-CoA dehydrogenase family protein [unclassified Novosphingobium]MBN9145147.1 acyl-CoA/acyl-ACP dehydrogenase [Novosphingobium sp.]MDR6709068.1 (2S)-methylsuccinyl-CoA dehydrogenase [Novosphingobium sp. 1748]ODU70906.1 MAG: acyl-CoA dehydrogenase [Novosphingobium sp. SCN 66-18]OJX89858.1 MAG: acyl-CoA dehydrogenase [Novosphingobium sp. 63-713]